MGAFLTYALDEGGALVHVDDVAKGAKCACRCPHCNAPLYAKNGGRWPEPGTRIHHFAHAQGHECEGAYESSLHLLAKVILQETGRIMLPKSNGSFFPSGSVRIRNVEIENGMTATESDQMLKVLWTMANVFSLSSMSAIKSIAKSAKLLLITISNASR